MGRPVNPNSRTTQLCKQCGASFTAYRHHGKRRTFCQPLCYARWLRGWKERTRDDEERDAENRSWRGFTDEERALYG